MGYYCDVKLGLESKAYEEFRSEMNKLESKIYPDYVYKDSQDNYMITFYGYKYSVIEIVKHILHEIEDNHSEEEKYQYRMVILGEDGYSEDFCSEYGYDSFDSMGVEIVDGGYYTNPVNNFIREKATTPMEVE